MTTELLHLTVILPSHDLDQVRMLVGLAGSAANIVGQGDRIDSWWTTDCQGDHAAQDWLKCVESACRPSRVWVSWALVTGGWYQEAKR